MAVSKKKKKSLNQWPVTFEISPSQRYIYLFLIITLHLFNAL